jgi:outer membrane protein OmpA-like peptidoglycan-associated protein
MRKFSTGLLLATTLLVAPAVALADDVSVGARNGWYASLGAGLNIERNSSITGGAFNNRAEFNNGFVGNGALGYSFGSVRVEGEIPYRRNGVDKLAPATTGGGHTSSVAGMANAYYDFLPDSRFDPYVGAGIGVARVNFSGIRGAGATVIDDSDTVFAYQGIVGARYLVAPQWDLGAEYRYFATADADLKTTAAAVPANTAVSAPYSNHSLMLNLTYHFGTPAPTPVAAAPPPPPAPVAKQPPPPPPAASAPPAPTVYIVFFAFDKSDISAVSAQVLDRAIADFRQSGSVKFLVQGYTDLAGTEQYNQKLSERRADAVKQYLLAHGVKVGEITEEWFGKKNPRVPTKDGERNQENRRAEIYLKK